MARPLLPLIYLVCIPIYPAHAADAVPGSFSAATVRKLDPWSLTQAALLPSPPVARKQIPQSRADFLAALERNRPRAVAKAGGTEAYASTMTLREAATFKGFTYEQSLVRRWNLKRGGPRFRLSEPGHPYVDIEQFDPISGKTIRTIQAYGGNNPRAAIEKLLVSDRDAEKLVVPSDVHGRIKAGVNECETVWSRMRSGDIDSQTANRLIRARAGKVGLRFDPTHGELYAEHQVHGRSSFGRLGTPEIKQQLGRIVRDRLTSNRVEMNQLQAMLVHQRLSTNFAKRIALQAAAANDRALYRAALAGVSPEAIDHVFNDLIRALEQGTPRTEALHSMQETLSQLTRDQRRIRVRRGQGVLLTFALVAAATDYAASDQELDAWLKSDQPAEWVARASLGIAAVTTADAVESTLVSSRLASAGEQRAARLGTRLASRIVAGGIAGAIFVAGEGITAAAFQGASWGEAADHAYDIALVIAVSEGAVLSAELLIYGEVGAIGGPLGVAISIGAGLLFEGGKYFWTSRRELESDGGMFVVKCEVARQKVKRWCDRACETIPSQSYR